MKKELLKKLGLTKYEIEAYLALLDSGPVTAYKLGKKSGVPSGRIYDVADKLALKGLASEEPGKPKRYKAVEPEKAINSLLNKKERKWKDTKQKIENLIPKLKKTQGIEDPISVVKEKEIYYQKVKEAQESAEEELLNIAGGLTGEKKGVDLIPSLKDLVDRAVEMKMIVPLSEENKETANKIKDIGGRVRDHPTGGGLRMILIDGKLAHLAIDDEALPYDRATISVRSKKFCKGLKEMFGALWEEAEPI